MFQAMPVTPETFQQANPVLAGAQASTNLLGANMIAQLNRMKAQTLAQGMPYVGPTAAAALQKAQLTNQGLEAGLPYIGPQAAANVGLTNAQAGAQGALGNYYGAEGNKINQLLPYDVTKAKATIYSDPVLLRAQQMGIMTNQDPAAILAQQGLFNPPNGQPQVPGGGYQVPGINSTGAATPAQAVTNLPHIPGGTNMPLNQTTQQVNTGPGMVASPQTLGGAFSQVTPMTAPKLFSGTPLQNWLANGTVYNPIQYQGAMTDAKSTAKGNVDAWNKAQADAEANANSAATMQAKLNDFNDAYNKSNIKGSAWALAPNEAQVIAARAKGGDFSNEQVADSDAHTLAALQSHVLFQNQRVTNNEVQIAGTTKPSRLMDPQAVQKLTAATTAQAQRINEYQQFLNAARQQGNITPQTAQAIFQAYNQQRPWFNPESGKAFTNSAGAWHDYLTPAVVNAVQNGQQPPVLAPPHANKAERDQWFKALEPQDQQQYIMQLQAQGGNR